MKLTEKQIDDFKKIYLNVYKTEISDKKATEYGIILVNLVRIISK